MDKDIGGRKTIQLLLCDLAVILINDRTDALRGSKKWVLQRLSVPERFVLNVHGRWDEAGQDKECIAWACEFFEASAQYASTGPYVNFMTQGEVARVEAAYDSN